MYGHIQGLPHGGGHPQGALRHYARPEDPRVSGLISIVKLDLARDLSHCKVYISSMDGIAAAKSAAAGLRSAQGFIKRELNARLKLRKLPEFSFIADDSIAHSADIARILDGLHTQDQEH